MTEQGPLDGIRVIEIGTTIAAPYAGKILSELGAEVVKIENPEGGDTTRHWGKPHLGGQPAVFQVMNKGKRSVTADLTDEKQRDAVARLCADTADAVLQNLRPGAAERLGLGPDDLLARNPRLVYCSVGAFGRQGPLSQQPGYDPLMQGFSGFASITGHPDRPPARTGSAVIDLGTAMWAVIGILAALRRREQTGKGGAVDASLYETALAFLTPVLATFEATGVVPARTGLKGPFVAPNRDFEAADGLLMITTASDGLFRRLAEAIGQPELTADDRFATTSARLQHEAELTTVLGPILQAKSRAEWADILNRAGVPNAPVHDLAEALAHPQAAASGMVQQSPDGSFRAVGLPLSFDGIRPAFNTAAPALGADDQLLFDFMED